MKYNLHNFCCCLVSTLLQAAVGAQVVQTALKLDFHLRSVILTAVKTWRDSFHSQEHAASIFRQAVCLSGTLVSTYKSTLSYNSGRPTWREQMLNNRTGNNIVIGRWSQRSNSLMDLIPGINNDKDPLKTTTDVCSFHWKVFTREEIIWCTEQFSRTVSMRRHSQAQW